MDKGSRKGEGGGVECSGTMERWREVGGKGEEGGSQERREEGRERRERREGRKEIWRKLGGKEVSQERS